jgi:hypothetical protein
LIKDLQKRRNKLEREFKKLTSKTDLAMSDFRKGLTKAARDVERAAKAAIAEFRKGR